MTDIAVLARTQIIEVDTMAGTVSVINAGPQGPPGVPGALTTEQAIDIVAGALVEGNKIDVTYDDPAGTITIAHKEESIDHDWKIDGWTPFGTSVLINDDTPLGNQALQTLSVVNGRGRITNTGTQGSLRKVYPRNNTLWMDSEITTLCYGSDVFNNGGTNPAIPQGGHFHRGYFDGTGRWRGIAVNNNIFLSDVNVINANVWNMDPTEAPADTLDIGSNGGAKTYSDPQLKRFAQINGVRRFVFGSSFNVYYVDNRHGLEAGEMVTIDTELDNTFDIATAQAISFVNSSDIQLTDAEGGAAVTTKFEQGMIIPTSISARMWWPYWLKSRLIGSKLSVKAWRKNDPEPDWGDPSYVLNCDFAAANVPTPEASYPDQPGYCGLIGNHIRNGRYFEYGHFSARKL